MASGDLIVRVRMADVQKFVADGRSVSATTDQIGRSGERAGQIGSGGFGLLGKSLSALRRTAFLAGGSMTAMSALVIKNGLSYNAAFQSAETSFTTLLGSSGRAKTLMDQLRDVSNGTPLRFTEVLDASKRMLGMGVSADRTVNVLKGLNAAILATGGGSEQFDRASLALGQMQAKGKASAEELMQLAEAGVPVNKILQRELGMTAGEVDKIGESGIDSGKVLDAIARGWRRRFGRAAKNARNDWNNQTAQLTKDWEQFQRIITKPLFVRLNTDVMPRLMRTVRAATAGFQQGFEQGGMIAGLDLMFRRMDIAAGAGGHLIKAWRGVVAAGRDIQTVLVGGVVPAFVALAGPLGMLPTPLNVITGLLGLMADHTTIVKIAVIALAGAYVTWRTAVVASNVVNAISANLAVINTARTAGLTAATTLQATATGKATLAQRLLNLAMRANPMGIAITAAIALAGLLVVLWKRSETFRAAVHWMGDALQAVWGWVSANWSKLLIILTGPIGGAVVEIVRHWDTISAAFIAVYNWIKTAWQNVSSLFAAPFGVAARVIGRILAPIEATIGRIMAALPGGASAEGLANARRTFAPRGINAPSTGAIGGIPARATGGRVREPWTLVGERGPELVSLPAGAYVHTAAESRGMMGRADGRPLVVQVQLDRRTIAEALVSELRAVQARA